MAGSAESHQGIFFRNPHKEAQTKLFHGTYCAEVFTCTCLYGVRKSCLDASLQDHPDLFLHLDIRLTSAFPPSLLPSLPPLPDES